MNRPFFRPSALGCRFRVCVTAIVYRRSDIVKVLDFLVLRRRTQNDVRQM
jgi:hypothetical protein